MRHFIVLGFASNSQKDPGKQVHLGADRSEAIAEVNKADKKYQRKELYELAIPDIRRSFITPATQKEQEKAEEEAAKKAAKEEAAKQAAEEEAAEKVAEE